MAVTMLASDGMTDGQIDDLANKLRDAARKHRRDIPQDAAQQALRSENSGMRLFAAFREIAEAMTGLVLRTVKVNRSRTPQQTLDATGRNQYTDKKVVAAMPSGEGDEVELIFFKPRTQAYDRKGGLSPKKLDEEYDFFGVKPDPKAQADHNAADPAFADEHPNACQWTDEDGNYCYAAFDRWRDERLVSVKRDGNDWRDDWVFAGVRKKSSASAV